LIHLVVIPEINNFYIIILDIIIKKYCIGRIAYLTQKIIIISLEKIEQIRIKKIS